MTDSRTGEPWAPRSRAANGGGVATASDTLTITDNRTGQDLRGPDRGRDGPRHRPARDQGRRRRLRPDDLRPGVHEHRVVPLRDHVPRRRAGHPRVPRLPDRAARRAVDLPRGRLPARSTASCPTQAQLDEWTHEITIHTFVHENVKSFMQGFRYDAHPMGMLLASVGALSTFYPDANEIQDAELRYLQIDPADREDADARGVRLPPQRWGSRTSIRTTTCATPATSSRMLYKMTELKYQPDPRLERALDILFILHADHEQNCSTNAVRAVGSSQVDPYSAVAAGVAALYGPLHGGANEAVLRMLRRIETKENIPDFIAGREGRQGAPDGLRPPRLQELRPAREDHQEGAPTTSSRSPASTRCSRSRSSSRRSRSRTTTSSSASSTRTSTSTRA